MTESELLAAGYIITYRFIWQRSVLLEDAEGNVYAADFTDEEVPKFFNLQMASDPDKIVIV